MTSNVQPNSAAAATGNTGMRSEISQKWGKLSTAEIAALKNKDDLVAQVQSKYSLDKAQAQRDVDAFAPRNAGRPQPWLRATSAFDFRSGGRDARAFCKRALEGCHGRAHNAQVG